MSNSGFYFSQNTAHFISFQARAALEEQMKQEAQVSEAERQRIRELEEYQAELEKLLEEERRAKEDEEIVRNLQAK